MIHRASLLTWTAVKQLVDQGAVALLPIGSTEAHGPHLPLGVDVVIAEHVCTLVSERLSQQSFVMFPALTYSLTEFASPFTGTVSLSRNSALLFLTEVVQGIVSAGFSRVVLVNHHLEPAHFSVVRKVAKAVTNEHVTVIAPDHRHPPVGPELGDEFMHGGSHAGCYETSLMLAAAPDQVDEKILKLLPENAVNLPEVIRAGATNFLQCGGPQAYFGAPAKATAEEGRRLFEVIVAHTVSLIA